MADAGTLAARYGGDDEAEKFEKHKRYSGDTMKEDDLPTT